MLDIVLAYAMIIYGPLPVHDIYTGLKNAAGEYCCGPNDCRKVEVTEVAGGWQLANGVFVPYAKGQPSPDTSFHACWNTQGNMTCFLVPAVSF